MADVSYRWRLAGFWDFGSTTGRTPYDLTRTLCATRVLWLLHGRCHCVLLATTPWPGHELSPTRVCPSRTYMRCMYGASLFIMVRSVFRAVEHLQGFDGYLLSHELYLYGFDAILKVAVMLLLNFIHPSGGLPGPKDKESNRDTLGVHLDRFYRGLCMARSVVDA